MMHCKAQCSLLTDVLSALDLASQPLCTQYSELLGCQLKLLMLSTLSSLLYDLVVLGF
jgi:hypothetical protein